MALQGYIVKLIEAASGKLPVVDSATGTKLDAANVLLGQLAASTDAPASATVDEDTTSRGLISLIKGAKNLLIDAVGHLATLAGCVSAGAISVHLGETLSHLLDSIDVAKMSKGAVTTAHSAITATATSAEIDCRGFNSLLIHLVTASTDKTWTISILGATGSGLTFAPHLDKTTGLADSVIATDISGFFVVNDIPDYVKIVATDTDDTSTAMTLKVQPFNS
jgi:hypothetical protein